MHYLIYKTTNKINGKIYIGSHKTDNPNDEYLGSGTYLCRAIKKYGLLAFQKEILFEFENAPDMFAKERELVTADFVQRKDNYNLKIGGEGGWDHLNNGSLKSKNRRFNCILQKNLSGFSNPDKYGKEQVSEWQRKGQQAIQKMIVSGEHDPKRWSRDNPEKMRQISDSGRKSARLPDAIIKRKKTFQEIQHQQGKRNSQFGTCWITKEGTNKKIKVSDLSLWIKNGWVAGRKC